MNDEPIPSFSFSRKWSQRINVLVGIVALLAIVGMVNYLAARHYRRFHYSSNDRAELSPLSRRLVGLLTNDVRIICYYPREKVLYSDVRELLKEYRLASSRITANAVTPMGPDKDPDRVASLVAALCSPAGQDTTGQVFGVRGREVVLLGERETLARDLAERFGDGAADIAP